jgi:hypothetical protein
MKKAFLFLLATGVVLWAGTIWYNSVISSNYWVTAPAYQLFFLALLLVFGAVVYYQVMKKIKNASFVVFAFMVAGSSFLNSCTYSKANQLVLYSEDCGANWKQVPAGSRVPSGTGNYCFIKETMPGYEMQGEMDYYVLFKDKVKVKIKLNYSYLIKDPLLFMKQAKRLGKTNADADQAQDDNARFEAAENTVIETRIKSVTSDEFVIEDVVSHNINELEVTYQELVNNELKSRGVEITFFEMVPDFQPLTQQAIDAANAERVYEAKGMKEYGRQITLAKAGATQINLNTKE